MQWIRIGFSAAPATSKKRATMSSVNSRPADQDRSTSLTPSAAATFVSSSYQPVPLWGRAG